MKIYIYFPIYCSCCYPASPAASETETSQTKENKRQKTKFCARRLNFIFVFLLLKTELNVNYGILLHKD